MRHRHLLGMAWLLALLARPVLAREEGFDAQAFRPLGAPQEVVGVGQSRPLAHASLSTGAFLHFALEPLVLAMQGSPVKALSVVGPRLQVDVLATVGVADWVEAGLTLPLVVAQASDNLEALGTEGQVRPFALGDLRLHGKVALPGLRRRAEEAGPGAALTLGVGLPTGAREAFAGEGALAWTPGAVVDWRFGSGALLSLNAGLWLRPGREFAGVRWGNAATFGLGAEVPIVRRRGITAVGTLTGSVPLEVLPGQAAQVPAEVLVGLRWYRASGLTFTVGGGGGCGCALTAPTLRLFASVVWVSRRSNEWEALERYKQPPEPPAPRPPPVDADGDFLLGEADRCPEVAGPVENGGCPDTDADGDGVVDRRDACPRQAAGPRGREGCPLVRMEEGRLVLLYPVRFATGQAVLLPDALPLLEEVATLLLAHAQVQRVRVEASTHLAGHEEEARALSRRRAATVRQHLLESGIAEERLCAVGRAGDSGQRVEFLVEPPTPGPPPPCSEAAGMDESPVGPASAEALPGLERVHREAWKAARGLKREGAWVLLALRVEEGRVRLLGLHKGEGSGPPAEAADTDSFRAFLEVALYRYRRGHTGEVVLTLRRSRGSWLDDVDASGPVPSATSPLAPYEAFLRLQRERLQSPGLSEEARTRGHAALARMDTWLLRQPEGVRQRLEQGHSPRAVYEALLREAREEERLREERWRAVERKLAEYEEWSRRLLQTHAPPPRRVAPGYRISESPLREQSLRALGRATLDWAWSHTEDPDFLRRSPEEVALYLLASRASLATAVELGRGAPVLLDYNPAFDPEVYAPEELLVEVLVGLLPVAGEVADADAALSGKSLTGHPLTPPERTLHAMGVLLPFVGGSLLTKGDELGPLALRTGRGLDEVRVLSRVASHLSPGDVREIERLLAAASKGHAFSAEELRFLQRVARGLEAPLREAAESLRAGRKLPLVGVRALPDGSPLLPGSPAHKAQRWVDYQFRHPEKYPHFSFQVDPEWERMYHTILRNRPAGSAFENDILHLNQYERSSAMMMPPPGSRVMGFLPDSVKGNPPELVWGAPYRFVEAKARQYLSLSGNLKAMIEYVEKYGGHLELWIRSARHPDGPTKLSEPLIKTLKAMERRGRARVNSHP